MITVLLRYDHHVDHTFLEATHYRDEEGVLTGVRRRGGDRSLLDRLLGRRLPTRERLGAREGRQGAAGSTAGGPAQRSTTYVSLSMDGHLAGYPMLSTLVGSDVDANGVDRPVALVAGVAPTLGAALVHGLVQRGYEVWASETCVPDAGLTLPLGRVHPIVADLDTSEGCDGVLAALCATRRPVATAALSVVGASSARLGLIHALRDFMASWGRGRLLLVADAPLPAELGYNVLPPARDLRRQPLISGDQSAGVTTVVIGPDSTGKFALGALLDDRAHEVRHNWLQRLTLASLPRLRRRRLQ